MRLPITLALLLAVVSIVGCKDAPDCTGLVSERSAARERLRLDELMADRGDSYAAASLSYDRDEVRRAEKRYDEACLK